jgi:hypothetical protein
VAHRPQIDDQCRENEGEDMRRIFSGTQREAIINHDGCCVKCGFIESGLIATETENGKFETLCEECLAPNHLKNFSKTVFQVAYLPELSTPVVAHYSRLAAWYYFASRMGETIEMHCGYSGKLPEFTSQPSWWEKKLSVRSYEEAKRDMAATVTKLRQMRSASQTFAFLKGRVDSTRNMYGDVSAGKLQEMYGREIFEKNFRLIPTGIPVSRIRFPITQFNHQSLMNRYRSMRFLTTY